MRAYSIPVILSVLFLFFVSSIQAVEVRAEIWRKKRDDGSYCYVYGMYDFHLPNLMANLAINPKIKANDLQTIARNQYSSLVASLKKLSPQDIMVLIEDSYTYRDGQSVIPAGLFMIFKLYGQATDDMLFEISQRLTRDTIGSVNIDHRQKKMAANVYDSLMLQVTLNIETLKKIASISDPFVKTLNSLAEFQIRFMQQDGLTGKNILQYDSVLNFKMRDIIDGLDAEIDKILKYDDGKELYHYYRDQIRRIRAQGKLLYEKMQKAKEQQYRSFAISFGEKVGMFGVPFCAYAGALLDLNALHEIVQNEGTKKKIFLIAGAAHVDKVFLLLPKLGYEPVYECGLSGEDVHITTKVAEEAYDINSFFTMNAEEFRNKLNDGVSKINDVVLSAIAQKNGLLPRFFDLMVAQDPEQALNG